MNAWNPSNLSGVIPALLTPFDEVGKINVPVLRELLDWHLEAGVHGFYVGGSTGEGLLLSLDERKELLEAVVGHLNARVPVLAHVGSIRTCDAVELAKHAASVGADAVSAIPPVYYQVGREGIELHYRRIVESTNLPFIIYNIPDVTGGGVDVDAAQQLTRLPNVIGIKFSDYNLHQLQLMTRLLEGRFIVFNGMDEVFLSGLVAGAVGGIGGTYNMMPHLFLEVYQRFLCGDIAGAQEYQGRINQAIQVLFEFAPKIINAVRAVVAHLGFGVGPSREPLPPLSKDEHQRLMGRLRQIGFFERSFDKPKALTGHL